MNYRKILTVVGARPQFIKAAVVSREIEKADLLQEVIIHTGQHFDPNMSQVFFDELSIPKPDYNLGINGGSHGDMTGRMIGAIEGILIDERPDIALVFGDTNSTLAGALAAAKLNIPVAHVEAGLRSFNRRMPEETNRVLTDHASDYLLCPTEKSEGNLLREGFPPECIYVVGDVMFDAARFYRDRAREPEWFKTAGLNCQAFYLATLHRAENTDDPDRLRRIVAALDQVDHPVILPLHPRTKERMEHYAIFAGENVFLTDPVSFLEMAWLERNCVAVATDSGGVQKEAYFSGKHCVIMRDETEWSELIEVGAATLAGTKLESIRNGLIDAPKRVESIRFLFGDGRAGQKIAELLIREVRIR